MSLFACSECAPEFGIDCLSCAQNKGALIALLIILGIIVFLLLIYGIAWLVVTVRGSASSIEYWRDRFYNMEKRLSDLERLNNKVKFK